jgi:hypothetical protein
MCGSGKAGRVRHRLMAATFAARGNRKVNGPVRGEPFSIC